MLWRCLGCGTRYAAGLPRCPHCRSEEYEEDGMAKITSGGVSFPEGHEPDGGEEHVHPGTGGEMHGIEHPADGTMSPPVSNDEPGGAAPPEPDAEPVTEAPAPPADPEPEPAPAPAPAPAPRMPPRRPPAPKSPPA